MDAKVREAESPASLTAKAEFRPIAAEFMGTLILVLFGVGSAVLAGRYIGALGIALTFGLTLLVLAYGLGPISGSHVNPAVTLGMLLSRRIPAHTAIEYWVAQLLGGIAGAALLLLVASQVPGVRIQGAFGTNGYGSRSLVGIPLTGASVNPARSLGPAVFAGPAALSQLWVFLVAPLVGGALAAAVHRITHPAAHDGEDDRESSEEIIHSPPSATP